ncbi:mitochondrial ribosomal protein subunit L20-domain-containing protein [Dichotomopilus funicola]|uniref:Mitochondrial ribosomal protein subunit L20-domain-containing protein n=1 Tax=Dichotomopilus funicola TaxID=1934379 RepID=A0AAN6ZS55_9PEZI|nr:mitochondrial ribosomal protein subunit L20-domain-containing protein [Dichotomopilus funicola]
MLPSGVRHKATSARTRRALRIGPHGSFISPDGSPADRATRPTADHIIYNPPASAASVLHTPFKFLPTNDPRRRANLASELFSVSHPASASPLRPSPASAAPTPTSSTTETSQAPPDPTVTSTGISPESFPALGKRNGEPLYKPQHHLTKEDIEEMRRLRTEDPVTNSVLTLAKRFKCSKLFVLMVCQAPRGHKEKIDAQLTATKERWGPRRRAAREERAARLGLLFNGQL